MSRLCTAALILLTLTGFARAQDAPAPSEEKKAEKPDEKKTEADEPTYRLVWDMVEGAELSYRQTQTIEQDLFGTDVKNVNVTDYTLHCLGFTDEGSVKLEYEYDRIALKVETAGIDLDYDSDDPDPAELEKLPEVKGTAALVGKKFSYEVTLELKVENLKGWDKVREQVLEQFDATTRAGLEPSYSDATRISSLEAGLRGLPKEKVKVGDEWTNFFDEPAGDVGVIKHDWTIKLASVETKDEHRLATLKTTAKLKFEKYADGPYKDMKVVLKDAEETATEIFDIDKGYTREQSSSTKMTMTYEVGREVLTHVLAITVSIKLLPGEKAAKDEADKPEEEPEAKPD
ncbi:MAG: hypothetical protein H6839_02110 [Planctomycetes bacterium]|nr:hypothetical protein [Planctomycetota bacterium]